MSQKSVHEKRKGKIKRENKVIPFLPQVEKWNQEFKKKIFKCLDEVTLCSSKQTANTSHNDQHINLRYFVGL